MADIIIIGAGGQAKVVADIAIKAGYNLLGFVDDFFCGELLGYKILGKISDIPKISSNAEVVIGVGDNKTRKRIADENPTFKWATIIHPSAQIGLGVNIGEGTVVMANAVINPQSVIGNHCIINTAAVIEHDNVIGDYVHVSPGAMLAGTVTVGDYTHIGIGAIIKNNIDITSDCLIGAGATVVKNIYESGVYIGTPAKKKC